MTVIKFERKRDGNHEADLSIKQLNVFAQAVELAKLEKEGYTVTPWKYHSDFNGALTNKVWLYKARKKGYTISIYA